MLTLTFKTDPQWNVKRWQITVEDGRTVYLSQSELFSKEVIFQWFGGHMMLAIEGARRTGKYVF